MSIMLSIYTLTNEYPDKLLFFRCVDDVINNG